MSEVGGPKLGLMDIGEEAKPPFAVLADPSSLFLIRAKRFAALAPGHALGPYLGFLARLTQAQHNIQAAPPAASLPGFDRIRYHTVEGKPKVETCEACRACVKILYEVNDPALEPLADERRHARPRLADGRGRLAPRRSLPVLAGLLTMGGSA